MYFAGQKLEIAFCASFPAIRVGNSANNTPRTTMYEIACNSAGTTMLLMAILCAASICGGCCAADRAHNQRFEHHRHHSSHSQSSKAGLDCKFDNKVMFIDIFGTSSKSPWLLCAVETAIGMLGSGSIVVITDDLVKFSSNWPATLPNPGRAISIPQCLEGTPLRRWLDSQELAMSEFFEQNIANALRLAAVYKSGGVYLDLDIIPLHKDLFDVSSAAVARHCDGLYCDSNYSINNSYLSFPVNSAFLHMLMEAFVVNYNGSVWGWNGPRLVSNLYTQLSCDGPAGKDDCNDLHVLPAHRLSPFHWDKIVGILCSQSDEYSDYLMNSQGPLAIHVYHNQWKNICIPKPSVFQSLMLHRCPVVTATHDTYIYCQHDDVAIDGDDVP